MSTKRSFFGVYYRFLKAKRMVDWQKRQKNQHDALEIFSF